MIKYLTREQIDEEKYNECIKNSLQSLIYGYSWYLDIVTDNWDALVLDDYVAVMPLPWRKKYFIKYLNTPLRILELGVFSTEKVDENKFLEKLFSKFKYANLRMNCHNSFSMLDDGGQEKHQQVLKFSEEYSVLYKNYSSGRKKDLKRAEKASLIEKWNDNPENLIKIFKDNVGKRFKYLTDKDYQIMKELLDTCIQKKLGEILSVYSKENKLAASGFFVIHENQVNTLFYSSDFNDRKNGANTFLIDRAIYKYRKTTKQFGFGGSSIPSIAKFFKSFGSETLTYTELNYNNLPKILKLFKK
ncbi:MAG: hypothetical protein JXR05_06590 [Flavobacteriaceae bacterium]